MHSILKFFWVFQALFDTSTLGWSEHVNSHFLMEVWTNALCNAPMLSLRNHTAMCFTVKGAELPWLRHLQNPCGMSCYMLKMNMFIWMPSSILKMDKKWPPKFCQSSYAILHLNGYSRKHISTRNRLNCLSLFCWFSTHIPSVWKQHLWQAVCLSEIFSNFLNPCRHDEMLARYLLNVNPREAVCKGDASFPQTFVVAEVVLLKLLLTHFASELLNALAIANGCS